jgi:hypothetical protein
VSDGQIHIGWDEKSRMNEATNKWTEKPRRRGIFSGLGGFLFTTLLLVALLYVAVFIIGRLDGFRAFLEDHLKSTIDLRVKVAKVWLTPSLNLEFEGLSTENFGRKGMPGLQIQNGFIAWSVHDETGWHMPSVRRAVMRGVQVTFAPDDYGRWEPTPLAPVGERIADWCNFKVTAPKAEKPLPRIEEKPGMPSKVPPNLVESLRKMRLEIADARLVWWDADGIELAAANKLRLAILPITLPSREVTHYWLRIDEATLSDGRRAHDIRVEFFDLGEQKMMLELCADWFRGASSLLPATKGVVQPSATNATPAFTP